MHWKCFRAKSTSVTHHLLRGATVLCPCRQETQPANHLASLHDLHSADKAVLVKCPLQSTVLCSEKFKIKILKFHHQKGKLRRLPSWNEGVSPLLFTCKTTIQNLVVYCDLNPCLCSLSQNATWGKTSSNYTEKYLGAWDFCGLVLFDSAWSSTLTGTSRWHSSFF